MVTREWNGYRNKSQHRKSTLEKKILPPFQQGFEPATFQSRVRRSNHWAIPAPLHRNCQNAWLCPAVHRQMLSLSTLRKVGYYWIKLQALVYDIFPPLNHCHKWLRHGSLSLQKLTVTELTVSNLVFYAQSTITHIRATDRFRWCSTWLNGCTEEGEGRGREIIYSYVLLHCHHQNNFGIKMGSDAAESHFNVSLLIVRDRAKITRPCSQSTDHKFWRERRAEADSNRGPSARPNAAKPAHRFMLLPQFY